MEDNDFTNDEDDMPDELEVDAGVVAHLDQEEAEFFENREQFQGYYGFDHDCHCSTDYTAGKMGMVTECFLKLTSDALNRCAEATHEIRVLSAMLDEMLAMNNDLVRMMEELGHEKELEEFFQEDSGYEGELQLTLEDLDDEELASMFAEEVARRMEEGTDDDGDDAA